MYYRNYGLQKTWLETSIKSPVYKTLDKQHGKRSQALLKSPQQHLY